MVFNRKDAFFLDLGSEGAQPAKVAIKEPAPELISELNSELIAEPALKEAALKETVAEETVAVETPVSPVAAVGVTTAEAIAAELRAAQEALPPPSLVTFAPDCLNPANAVPSRRRTAGANLGEFKAMAKGLFKP